MKKLFVVSRISKSSVKEMSVLISLTETQWSALRSSARTRV